MRQLLYNGATGPVVVQWLKQLGQLLYNGGSEGDGCFAVLEQLGQLLYTVAMYDREENHERVVFGSFDPAAEVEIIERNLPHWFQAGAAMFVTFRSADSLPRDVIVRWRQELKQWLALRGLPLGLAESTVHRRRQNHNALLGELSAAEHRELKRLTDRLFHGALDECHGKCLLRRPELAKIVADALLFYQETTYDLDRFIVMPNHAHAIVQFRGGASLKTISESWMRFTARKINAATGRRGAYWQPEPFDHIIRSPEQFVYLQRYTADNPKKAHLRRGEFLYWERPRV